MSDLVVVNQRDGVETSRVTIDGTETVTVADGAELERRACTDGELAAWQAHNRIGVYRTAEDRLAEAHVILEEAGVLATPVTPADLADILARAAAALNGGV